MPSTMNFFFVWCSILYMSWTVIIVSTSPTSTEAPNNTAKVNDSNISYWEQEIEDQCNIQNNGHNISLECEINEGGVFNFSQFREWSKSKSRVSSITLSVICEEGGRVRLPWPFRSYNLTHLTVKDCRILDFFSERTEEDLLVSIADDLVDMKLLHDIIEIDFLDADLGNLLNVSSAYECGPLNARTVIWREVRMEIVGFPDISPSLDQDYYDYDYGEEEKRQALARANNNPKYTCNYKNMEVYESSQVDELSAFDLKSLAGNSYFPQLKVLNMTNTSHSSIPPELFTWRLQFPQLEILDLSHNNISRFDFNELSGRKANQNGYIDLTFNNISSLGAKEIKSIRRLRTALIDVRDNPFLCDCNVMNSFADFLRKYKGPLEAGIRPDYKYLWDLKCRAPTRLAGHRISDLTYSVLCDPDVSAFVLPLVVLSVFVIILVVVIIVITRYRKDIRILFFTRLNIILPFQPKEDDSNKRFDAFISYSQFDAEWVLKTLAPGLEKSDPNFQFKVCLHHRDFEIGAYISENVVSSVENSRHTVLVVSKKFLESAWCVLEFRTALNQSVLEKKKHMVIIMLEDIPMDKVDNDFKRCLQMMTYIKADDSMFWDRIRYALARKSRCRKSSANKSENTDQNV